jgi:poly-beta-1,6-N-acetyl-D-glucosamine synthase
MSAVRQRPTRGTGALRIVCVVSFLNEQRHLDQFLESVEAQDRPPDEMLLVDDGSSDDSPRIAREFVRRRPEARFLRRPLRPPARDRLADAAVVRAFEWAVSQLSEPWDVVVKMDADLALSPDLFTTIERAFLDRPDLGVAGTYLSIVDPRTGERHRERCPPQHARGPTKFYRRSCYEQIAPLPAMLGWDTIDELSARRSGWRTASVACAAGDTIHLRPTGAHDGLVRAQFRWGTCAYAIGQHPAWVLASAARRLRDQPKVIGSAAFLAGWLTASIRRSPRASAEVRAFGRGEQLRQLRRIGLALWRQPSQIQRALRSASVHDQ